MNYLITGGLGFIGKALISNLILNPDNSIRVIDDLSVGKYTDCFQDKKVKKINFEDIKTGPKGIEFLQANISNYKVALKATMGCDVVIHLAANTGVQRSIKDPDLDLKNNIVGTFNYLKSSSINQVKKFIFASSSAPVGNIKPPIHEEVPVHPLSPYGASKLAGEGYCSAFYHSFNLETIVLRFSNVYGPGSIDKSSVIAKFIKEIIKGDPLNIYGDGSQTRDFIYIDDLVNAIILSAKTKKIGGEIFQISTSIETSLNQLTNMLLEIFQEFDYQNIKFQKTPPQVGDIKRNFSSNNKARNILGWQNKIGLREGLKKTIKYFINEVNKS